MNWKKPVRGVFLTQKRWIQVLLVLLVTATGVGLRLYAADILVIDCDERVYLQAALQYNNYLRQGQYGMLAWDDFNAEHPSFYKVIVGFALFSQQPLDHFDKNDFVMGLSPKNVNGEPWVMLGRYVAIFFGGLVTLILSAVNPIAGLFFAIHTYAVKYTSTFFLEALPAMTSLLSALSYLSWYRRRIQAEAPERIFLLGLSAGFLGVSVASKYTYAVVGISVVLHFLGSILLKKLPVKELWKLAGWCSLALITFFAGDTYLWRHTFERLMGTFHFHIDHTQSKDVTAFPVWQPFVWFSAPFSFFVENSKTAFPIKLDTWIGLLALLGLPTLYKRQPFFFIWFVSGLVVLLIWPTKWPQYTMIIMVPICVSAAWGSGWLISLLSRRNKNKEQNPGRPGYGLSNSPVQSKPQ